MPNHGYKYKACVLRICHVEPQVGSEVDLARSINQLFGSVGGNTDIELGYGCYTLEEIILGVHEAQNWFKTNTGKSCLTGCLADMALYQGLLSYAREVDVTFDFLLCKIFEVDHPSRASDKMWLSFAPSAPPGNGLRLFGQNGMRTTGTSSKELLELANSIRNLGVSAYATHSFIHSFIHS
jgi:hypothetical protein